MDGAEAQVERGAHEDAGGRHRAGEAARKKEEGARIKAQKKAEAEAVRKAKAAEIAEQKKREAEERRAAEAAAAQLARELGIGTFALKGDRGYQEDRVIATRLPSGDLYMGVFDGHCGEACPEYCITHLHHTLAGRPEFARGDYHNALREAFHITNEDFMPAPYAPAPTLHPPWTHPPPWVRVITHAVAMPSLAPLAATGAISMVSATCQAPQRW